MGYIEKYHLIARTAMDFESKGRDFYSDLTSNPAMNANSDLLNHIALQKADELDKFTSMLTVSSFLLEYASGQTSTSEIANWLAENCPDIYDEAAKDQVINAGNPGKALLILINLEKDLLDFYKMIWKRIPTNMGQIDTWLKRQQQRILTLTDARKGIAMCFKNGLRLDNSCPVGTAGRIAQKIDSEFVNYAVN